MTSMDEYTDEEYIDYLRDTADVLFDAGTPTLAEDYYEAARRIEQYLPSLALPAATIVVTGPGAVLATGQTLKEAFDQAKANCDPQSSQDSEYRGHVVFPPRSCILTIEQLSG